MYQKNRKNTGNNQKRQPDYLWILATDTSLAARLAGKIEETKEFSSVVEKQKDNSILITNIRGKEDRALLIRLCKEFIYDCDGKILIGNGVKAEQNLSENKRLQQEVFELARNRAPGKHLYLIEQYYHELAISYISRKVGENGFKARMVEWLFHFFLFTGILFCLFSPHDEYLSTFGLVVFWWRSQSDIRAKV